MWVLVEAIIKTGERHRGLFVENKPTETMRRRRRPSILPGKWQVTD